MQMQPYVSHEMVDFLRNLGVPIMRHPPCTPDLDTSDFRIYSVLKSDVPHGHFYRLACTPKTCTLRHVPLKYVPLKSKNRKLIKLYWFNHEICAL